MEEKTKNGPMRKPTRKAILYDFNTAVERAPSDRQFQLERLVRRWSNCGYPLVELPALLSVSVQDVLAVAEKLELKLVLQEAWNFIENVANDDPERQEKFFALREKVRNVL